MLATAAPRRAPTRYLRAAAASTALAVLAGVGPAVASASPAPAAATASQATAPAINWWEIDLYNRVNGARWLSGTNPIFWHHAAGEQAGAWSDTMARRGQLAHHTALSVEASAADPAWKGYAEIVGRGPDTASVVEAFMASPTHRAEMLGDWRAMGVGVTAGHGELWVTVRFIR